MSLLKISNFLEAFLLQNAFVESLLKRLTEDDFFDYIVLHLPIPQKFKSHESISQYAKSEILKRTNVVRKKLLKQRLVEIIEYLYEIGLLSSSLRKKLNIYREKRNNVLHDLVGNIQKEEFEKEIETLVSEGQSILNDGVMIKASETI